MPGSNSETEAKRPRGNPGWRKGGPSPNPSGRPPSGLAFAERVRERVDPDTIIDRALQVLASDDDALALKAAEFLAGRGWIKPPTATALQITDGGAPDLNFGALDLAGRRQFVELLRTVGALPAPGLEASSDDAG